MTMAFVWVLVTVGGYNGNNVVYSPYLYDLESCQFLQKNLPRQERVYSQCVQIKVAK